MKKNTIKCNFKKLTCLALTIGLVFSSASSAFASDITVEESDFELLAD